MAGRARGRKSIFITGAASGMGRETAKLFHAKGWFIGAYDVNAEGLKGLEQEIGSDNCIAGRLDVTNKPDFDAAIAAFGEETGGKMDMLFANAGIGESGWFEDVPYEATLRLIQVNLIGVINSIYAALPLLKAVPNSLAFITSSSSATYGMPRIAVYSATKHGVKGLTEALSVEFARHKVRVADVLPGLIDTAILRSTPNRSGDAAKPTEEEFYANAPKSGMFRLTPGVGRGGVCVEGLSQRQAALVCAERNPPHRYSEGPGAGVHAQADRQTDAGPVAGAERSGSARQVTAGAAIEDMISDLHGAHQTVVPAGIDIVSVKRGRATGDVVQLDHARNDAGGKHARAYPLIMRMGGVHLAVAGK